MNTSHSHQDLIILAEKAHIQLTFLHVFGIDAVVEVQRELDEMTDEQCATLVSEELRIAQDFS